MHVQNQLAVEMGLQEWVWTLFEVETRPAYRH